jgi:protein TonB
MEANSDIYRYSERISRPMLGALLLHGLLLLSVIAVPILARQKGDDWGDQNANVGEAMSATMVSRIPLPANPDANNVLANDSAGVATSVPEKPAEVVEPKAIPIPEREAKPKSKTVKAETHTVTPPAIRKPQPAPVDDRIPFGEGGPVSGPYGVFSASNAKGGIGIAGGASGSINGYYVRIIREKISENWYKYQVGASVSNAHRVYIKFDIQRDGRPTGIEMEQSSGIPSLDRSAMQAVQRVDSFGRLPDDYKGRFVSVEFWFDMGH